MVVVVVVVADAVVSLDAGATRIRTAFTGKSGWCISLQQVPPFTHHFEWKHSAHRIAPHTAVDGIAQNVGGVPVPSAD